MTTMGRISDGSPWHVIHLVNLQKNPAISFGLSTSTSDSLPENLERRGRRQFFKVSFASFLPNSFCMLFFIWMLLR